VVKKEKMVEYRKNNEDAADYRSDCWLFDD
jgi:hypothetical protein